MNSKHLTIFFRNKSNYIKGFVGIVLFSLLFTKSITASRQEVNIYHEHQNQEMKIALTFDDGPHPILTPKILNILQKYNIKATFFIVGENATNYPEIVKLILDQGHEIGNHTFSHDHINEEEIDQCEKTIYELTDYKTKLFRPPEGALNQKIEYISKHLGYSIILWDIDTRDWEHTPPKIIRENVMKKIKAGSIILMHDYIGFNSPTPEALELIIPALLEQGYQFVVVSELIGSI